jgi:hypothetical protein
MVFEQLAHRKKNKARDSLGIDAHAHVQASGEEKDVAKMINDDIIWLNKNRSEICKGIPALENIIDELTSLHMKTLYKLENLR